MVSSSDQMRFAGGTVNLLQEIDFAVKRRVSDRALEYAMHDGRDVVTEADVLAVMRAAMEEVAVERVRSPHGRPSQASGTSPSRAEVTRRQAADVLLVSPPFVDRLIESGELPHQLVSGEVRLPLDAVVSYKRRTDAERHKVLDQLVRDAEELGFYD